MVLGTPLTRTRCAAVSLAATAVAAAMAAGLVPVVAEGATAVRVGALRNSRFDEVLVWLSAGVGLAVTTWLWLVTVLIAVDAARGRSHQRSGVPEGVRRTLLVLCGVALTAGVAAPAVAAGDAPTGPEVLAGLRLPERIGVQPAPAAARPASVHEVLVVTAGDTLWSLAADHLGRDASTDEIAAAWPALYAANRHVVGPDPSHIEPGQHLVLPLEGDEHDDH